MKLREPRRTVLIQARMRCGADWGDISIRNVSSRGMLVQAEHPPESGSYIEIRKGNATVVGRIVWRRGRHFGVRTQDRIDIGALTGSAAANARAGGNERRAQGRSAGTTEDAAERSGRLSSLFQYVVFALIGTAVAAFLAFEVWQMLSRPFATIERHLGG